MIEPTERPPVVFIHGLWLTPRCWEHWIDRFRYLGYPVTAPAWPGVAELHEPHDPDRAPADVGVGELADYYAGIVRTLPERPVLIGHSFGGLLAEILLDRGSAAAAVALAPAPARGVLRLPPAALRAAWPVLRNPANRHRAVTLTPAQFQYAFTNSLSDADGLAVYRRHAIPGPGRPLFEVALANLRPPGPTSIRFDNLERGPLLLVAGSRDHTVPASLVREAYQRQRRSSARTDLREFPGRDHFTVAAPGWEQVADLVLDWIAELPGGPTGRHAA